MSNNTQDFIKQLENRLKSTADDLDSVTAARLQAVRKDVLEKVADDKHRSFADKYRPGLYAASVAASVLMFSVAIFNMNSSPDLNIMDDLHLLSEKQSFEFYEEMEFYQWLDEADANG